MADSAAKGKSKRKLPSLPPSLASSSSSRRSSPTKGAGSRTSSSSSFASSVASEGPPIPTVTTSTAASSASSSPRRRSSGAVATPQLSGPSDDAQNVIVSVRVRPMNERELRADLPCIVSMQEKKKTTITGPTRSHDFTYDHSFWSCNRDDEHFDGQAQIYESLGKPLLDRCLEGYNCCLFAYGQTGSGKSYSMMGYKEEAGIIPRFSNELFDRIRAASEDPSSMYKVEVSYFEIYSERIYDLLLPSKSARNKTKLKVREHPVLGPYVENLSTYAALSYKDIENWIQVGGRHRATASTNMNATSSRSHAVFMLTVTQTEIGEDGKEHGKVSRVNLVDLAGSERSDSAGTSGQRLREGAAINKSLHTLGKVISILAERSSKRRKIHIPYRDSTLTWILKESLGGNAKTAMLATVSPSGENYDESLSTLRYAHRARSIVNEAKINEDPNQHLIKELRAEIERLRGQYGSQANMAEIQELRENLKASEHLMEEMNKSWQEKLAHAEKMRELAANEAGKVSSVENVMPNLVNLNEDPQLSEMLVYNLRQGEMVVGQSEAADIRLKGALVGAQHCKITCSREHTVTVKSMSPDAVTYINGVQLPAGEDVEVQHGTRIIIGNHHFFRLNNPREVAIRKKSFTADTTVRDYQFALEELQRIQAERIEAELEAEHKAQTELILKQLDEAKREAQRTIEAQQQEYQEKLEELARERREKDALQQAQQAEREQQLAAVQQEERDRAMAEIESERQRLDVERLELEARLAEEKAQAEQRIAAETEEKNRLIEELEREKAKIHEDVKRQQTANQERRKSIGNLKALSAGSLPLGSTADQKKGEWLRISQLIREANAIASGLKQNTVFRRADAYHDDDEALIKVNNTRLHITTNWSLEKFEARLDQMRELYFNQNDTLDAESLFYDPEDKWQNETAEEMQALATGASSAPTSNRHSISGIEYSDYMNLATALKEEAKARREQNGSAMDRLTRASINPGASRESLPGSDDGSGVQLRRKNPDKMKYQALTQEPSVPLLCRQYIKNTLAALKQSSSIDSSRTNDIIACVSSLQKAVTVLTETYDANKDGLVPIREQGTIRNASLSATMNVEMLCNTIRACRQSKESRIIEDLVNRLGRHAGTIANNLVKLLQGLENGIDSMVHVGKREILEDIKSIAIAAGELAIATDSQDDDGDDSDDMDQIDRDETEAINAVAARMVDVSNYTTPRNSLTGGSDTFENIAGIDQAILLAFEQGTLRHVEKSIDFATQDIEKRISDTLALLDRLNSASNVSRAVLDEAVNVVRATRDLFLGAQEVQAQLVLFHPERPDMAAAVFYRKNFSRSKGIVSQVQEVADAIAWLCDSCALATNGSDDVEQIMSHAKNLRSAVAHVLSVSDTKMGQESISGARLLEDLHTTANAVYRATNTLSKECQSFGSSTHGKLRRTMSLRSPARPRPSVSSEGLTVSPVKRKMMFLEQQSHVLRLEQELSDARKELSALNQAAYDQNASTSKI